MRNRTLLGVALLGLLLPAAATAEWDDLWGPKPPSMWIFALGAGYAFPKGEVVKDTDLSGFVRGAIPLQAELAYRLVGDLTLGAYFSYAFGLLPKDVGHDCDVSGLDCKAWAMRTGLQLTYALTVVSRSVTPWLGVGIGYEWMSLSVKGGAQDASARLRGWELVNAQAGLNIASGSGGWGPFVSYGYTKYDHGSLDLPGQTVEGSIDSKQQGAHGYLTAGLRLSFDL
jgi:opacity protein-like surface antigen